MVEKWCSDRSARAFPALPVARTRYGGRHTVMGCGSEVRRYILLACTCILLLLDVSYAAGTGTMLFSWPEWFLPPVPEDNEDTSRLVIGTQQEVYGQTVESFDSLQWRYADSSQVFLQRAQYELTRIRETQNQFLDLSGRYVRETFLGRAMSLGLDWSPWLVLSQRSATNGGFEATIDVGPVLEAQPWGIPLELRGGFSAKAWNNSIPADLIDTRYEDFHGAPGGYGGLRVGEPGWRPFDEVPFYGSLSAFGRSVEDAGLAVVLGSVLYGQGIPSGDSLFIYASDSLGNGRDPSLSEVADGKTRFIDTPWRIENALHVAAAFKGAQRFYLVPALIYALDQRLVTHPDEPTPLNDRKNTVNSLTFTAETDTSFIVRYRGGIRFELQDEDKLFRWDLMELASRPNAGMLLLKNNEDYDGTVAIMEHSLSVPFRNGMELAYAYSISRHSKAYRNELPDSTIFNYEDNDRQRQEHALRTVFVNTDSWQGTLRGEYSRQVLNYVRAYRSGANRTHRGYLIEASLAHVRGERFQLSEVLTAEANTTEYEYPSVHQGGDRDGAPPYSRRFTSLLSGSVRFNQQWMLTGEWRETYWDEGRWYGAEYFVDTAVIDSVPEKLDYYAIERKATQYTIGLSLRYTPREGLLMELGSTLEDMFRREYDGRDYETRHSGRGYVLEPYMLLRWRARRWWDIAARIERHINTYDEQVWDWDRNWDINVRIGLRM